MEEAIQRILRKAAKESGRSRFEAVHEVVPEKIQRVEGA
jgi:hypothetical protein